MQVHEIPDANIKQCSQGLMIKVKGGYVLLEGKWIKISEEAAEEEVEGERKNQPEFIDKGRPRVATSTIEQRVDWWRKHGKVTPSSETICHALTMSVWPMINDVEVPQTVVDFSSCQLLLDLIPEWNHQIRSVGLIYPAWIPYGKKWDDMVSLYKKGDYNQLTKVLQELAKEKPVTSNPYEDGFKNKFWYENNVLHREDGPAIEWFDGTKEWYQNGKKHRLDGPAVERYNGVKEWWVNGVRHRLDGPAIEYAGGKGGEWWKNGMKLSKNEFAYQALQK